MLSGRQLLLWLVAGMVLAATTGAAAVAVNPLGVDPIRQTRYQAVGVDQIVAESHQLNYDGSGDVTGVTVVVNSTRSTDLTVDVIAKLVARNGTTVASAAETVLLNSGGTTTATLSFTTPRARTEFWRTNVTVTQSL